MKKSVFTAILTAVATLILVACEKSGYIGPEQEGCGSEAHRKQLGM